MYIQCKTKREVDIINDALTKWIQTQFPDGKIKLWDEPRQPTKEQYDYWVVHHPMIKYPEQSIIINKLLKTLPVKYKLMPKPYEYDYTWEEQQEEMVQQ